MRTPRIAIGEFGRIMTRKAAKPSFSLLILHSEVMEAPPLKSKRNSLFIEQAENSNMREWRTRLCDSSTLVFRRMHEQPNLDVWMSPFMPSRGAFRKDWIRASGNEPCSVTTPSRPHLEHSVSSLIGYKGTALPTYFLVYQSVL